MKKIILSLSLLGLFTTSAYAETIQELSNKLDDNKLVMEASKKTYSTLFNKMEKLNLGQNGKTKTWFLPVTEIPMVDIKISVLAGKALDPKGLEGLSKITGDFLIRESANISEENASETLAKLGTITNVTTEQDRTIISIRCSNNKEIMTESINLLAELLHNPLFNPKLIEHDRKANISQLEQAQLSPGYLIATEGAKLIWGENHPYAKTMTVDSVSKISRDDMLNHYNKYYSDNNMSVSIVGSISKEDAIQITNKLLNFNNNSTYSKADYVSYLNNSQKELQSNVVMPIKTPTSQSHIQFVTQGLKKGDKNFFALYVGNYILGGGGFDSKLTKEIRVKNGLAYSAYSMASTLKDNGSFKVVLETKNESKDKAIEISKQVLADFIALPITNEELNIAKKSVVLTNSLNMSTNGDIVETMDMLNFYDIAPTYLENFGDNVAKVTQEDIKRVFTELVKLNKLNLLYTTPTL